MKFTPRIEKVEGLEAHVREISTGKLLSINEIDQNEQGLHLLLWSVCDESGKPAFENLDELKELPFRIFKSLMEASSKINNVEAEVEQKKS